MKLRDKNNSYYERRVVFMKNIIINNIVNKRIVVYC